MAFDFPPATTAGTEYTSGGITYVWSGSAWEIKSGGAMGDYVAKAGDTMTGALNLKRTAAGAVVINGVNESGGKTCDIRVGGGGTEGTWEFWTENGGWSTACAFSTTIGSGGGGIWVRSAGITMDGGMRFGSRVAPAPTDLTGHITLYGTHFGFSITSSTLNYVSSLNHNFYSGTALVYTIDNVGSIGNLVSGASFVDRTLMCRPELRQFAEGEDDNPEFSRRGINLGKVLLHALDRIRDLESKLAQLDVKKK